jgi:hypothetical protein
MENHEPPLTLDELAVKIATARAQLAEAAAAADRASTAHHDARTRLEELERSVFDVVNEKVAEVSSGYTTRALAAGVLAERRLTHTVLTDTLAKGTISAGGPFELSGSVPARALTAEDLVVAPGVLEGDIGKPIDVPGNCHRCNRATRSLFHGATICESCVRAIQQDAAKAERGAGS